MTLLLVPLAARVRHPPSHRHPYLQQSAPSRARCRLPDLHLYQRADDAQTSRSSKDRLTTSSSSAGRTPCAARGHPHGLSRRRRLAHSRHQVLCPCGEGFWRRDQWQSCPIWRHAEQGYCAPADAPTNTQATHSAARLFTGV